MKKVKQCVPTVGMPCTVHVGSDSYAAEVLFVSESGQTGMLKRKHWQAAEKFYCDKEGNYRLSGTVKWHITFGVAEDYRDPSF